MTGHEGGTRLHREGSYDTGCEGFCSCGWVGPMRELLRRGLALIDFNQHLRDEKERAA